MKNLLSLTLIIFFGVILLTSTIRGISGNPIPDEILNLRSVGNAFESSQSSGRYALTTSIVDDKSFFFSKDKAMYSAPDLGTANGNYVSLFAPGVSFVAIPFYILGTFLNFAQLITFSVSSLFAILNLVLIFLIVKRLTKNNIAGLISSIIFVFSTSSWSYALMLNQHHLTSFLLLFGIYLLLSPARWFTSFIFGLILGAAFLIEYPNLIFFIPLSILLLIRHFSTKQIDNKIKVTFKPVLILGVIGLIIGFAPSFLYNQHANGDYFKLAGSVRRVESVDDVRSNSGTASKVTISRNKTAVGLFSTVNLPVSSTVLISSKDRGILFFSPILILGLVGIIPLYRKSKLMCYTLVAGIGTIFMLYGMWGDPWGGWAFGPRYLIPAFAQLSILLGVAIATYGKKIWFMLLFFPLFIYSTFVSLIGALTTNQIPPSVEHESADLLPKLTYLHNLELLKNGTTGSFMYNTYLYKYLDLLTFAGILFASVVIMVTALYLIFVFSHHKK